jgi:hypothetical protein
MSQSSPDPRLIVSRTTPIHYLQPFKKSSTMVQNQVRQWIHLKRPVTNKFMFDYNSTTNLFTYNEVYHITLTYCLSLELRQRL